MEYVKPFTYFVGATGGFTNLLLCGVCNLIPIVGPMVLLGYRAEVAEELVRDRNLRRHPKFDFNRFGEYLTRGIWPFVYQLCVGLVAGMVFVAAVLVFGIGLAAAGGGPGVRPGPGGPNWMPLAAMALAYFVVILFTIIFSAFFLWPMELHGQLSQRFAPVEAFGFATRFQRLVWGQTLTSLIVFLLGSFVLVLVGLLACYFGLFLTIVIQFMAQQHLMTQLYRLYLDAGGDPIPTAEEEYDDEDDVYDEEDDDRRGPGRR